MSEQESNATTYTDTSVGQPVASGLEPSGGAVAAPIGRVRSTGLAIFLYIITLGIYGLYWFYIVHKEMKDHTDSGLGGPFALVLAFFVPIVMWFLTPSEIGEIHRRNGREQTVSGTTGLWYFPGLLLIVLPIVWFVKTNGAINDYWRSLGATG